MSASVRFSEPGFIMPVIRFPRPATPQATLAALETHARTLALSVRFAGRPDAAVRWAMSVSELELDTALAADDTLMAIEARRLAAKAREAGDMGKEMQLEGMAARLFAQLHSTARKHRISGWHH